MEAQVVQAVASGDWALADRLSGLLDSLDLPHVPGPPLGAALWYSEQGLRTFPCVPGGKVPYPRSRGVSEATTDRDLIRRWWEAHPTANVAIATGGLIDVVDFDGERGHAAWGSRYGLSWAGLTLLGTVSTPRPGGLHAYVPAAGEGNRIAMVPGVDYRGAGGYVLAPPSRTNSGVYRFLRPLNN